MGDHLIIRKCKYQSGDLWMMWQWDDVIWGKTAQCLMAFEIPGSPFWRADKTFIGTDYAIFYFYPNEPFYFYELYEPIAPHKCKGWYCNINTVAERTPDGYTFIDLDLDIWLYPDLHYEILDEDEYRENAVSHKYPAEYMQLAERTLEQLRTRIERLEFPFRANVNTLEPELEFLAERFNCQPISLTHAA